MRYQRCAILLSIGALVVVVAVGCGCGQEKQAGGMKGKTSEHAEHPHDGPHGGLLVEIGKEAYHVEVCHSDETHAVTLYVLDAAAKEAVPVADKQITINLLVDGKPAQFDLPAKPVEGEPAGQSSRFELVDQRLADNCDAEGAKARIRLSIAGTEYTGSIEHHEHDEHDEH